MQIGPVDNITFNLGYQTITYAVFDSTHIKSNTGYHNTGRLISETENIGLEKDKTIYRIIKMIYFSHT